MSLSAALRDIPDFEAAELSVAEVATHLQAYGALLLRGFFPVDLLAGWLPVFKAAFERADQQWLSGQMLPQTYQRLYRYGHIDSSLLPEHSQWLQSLLSLPQARSLLNGLYPQGSGLLQKNSLPRRQRPDLPEFGIAFHQDQEFLGALSTALNLWVPLTPAGDTVYPGLELLLPSPQQPLLNLKQSVAERERCLQPWLAGLHWRPQMQPGDLLIFGPFMLHRTFFALGMSAARISSEIRVLDLQEGSV